MALPHHLQRVLDWLLEGYPTGVPPKDYIPVLALLRQRLTDEDVRAIAQEVADRGGEADADIGVRITTLTDALPSPDEVERVRAHLEQHHGWPGA